MLQWSSSVTVCHITAEEVPSTCEGWEERGRNEDKSKIWIIYQMDTRFLGNR